MATLAERQAYWDQLRGDPDFRPEWLRTMGSRPSANDTRREWGDGANRRPRAHVIVDISYAGDYIICSCGWTGTAAGGLDWNGHTTGGQNEVKRTYEATALAASDEEVSAFLARISGEHVDEADPQSLSTAEPLPNEAEAHEHCSHSKPGKGGHCYVAYSALYRIATDDALYGAFMEKEFAS